MDKTSELCEDKKKKRFETHAFCIFSLIIVSLIVVNLTLTLLIVNVLRIGYGMESFELIPLQNLVKFYGNADLDKLYKIDGRLSGFKDIPTEISGMRSSVLVELLGYLNKKTPVPNLRVEKNGTYMRNISSFEVVDPKSGHSVFSTNFPALRLPPGVSKVDADIIHTHRIVSPLNTTLYLRSETVTRLKGNEGTRIRGKNVMWTADGDIFVKSVNGSLVLSGKNGIVIDLKSLQIAQPSKPNKTFSTHYKLCVCMPGGKIFKVPMSQRLNMYLACHHIDLSIGKRPC